MTDPAARTPSTARDGRLSYAVFQLARAHRGYASAMLRDMKLHPGQELLLMQLFDRDGQSQSELLESVGLDHSTVSKSLRRMQEAGLVSREPAEHDRRVMVVRLTDEGRAMKKPITAMWQTLEESSVLDLTPDDIEAFISIAYKIEQAVRERDHPDRRSDGPTGDGDGLVSRGAGNGRR
ncbi:MarR family winged helix-turn-helix transcriptional regulator [Streptomyces kunmingensis]|uniref:MarR family winged helix-turn-helix transcriptional regulator n=1 Tax=Streptomyces kunmingensis TaxID=68225 RepID=A0ABU6C6I3_9ACTN|nr:MarR family winged helix-turn-helix transcriptional regulator [Streptomyces kunmingensis]MEB3959940.1 MarR family winged helix-turn-helix transcriptional regulator [Streptomyces kunmingensis]